MRAFIAHFGGDVKCVRKEKDQKFSDCIRQRKSGAGIVHSSAGANARAATFRARCDYIPFVTPLNSYCHSTENLQRPPPCARHTPSVRRQFAAKREELSRVPLLQPLATYHGPAAYFGHRHAALAALTYCPSVLSSLLARDAKNVHTQCPAPPVSTQTNRPLPCSRFAELPLALYLDHTPPLRPLNHRAD